MFEYCIRNATRWHIAVVGNTQIEDISLCDLSCDHVQLHLQLFQYVSAFMIIKSEKDSTATNRSVYNAQCLQYC